MSYNVMSYNNVTMNAITNNFFHYIKILTNTNILRTIL